MLFSESSLWTMVHGIGFGGGALLALAALLFAMYLLRLAPETGVLAEAHARAVAKLTALTATLLWLTTLVGTYVVFPPYRVAPPEGATDLTGFPRSRLLADPNTAWLHRFAMETKEHLPWIAVMLTTAVAFVMWRYRVRGLGGDGLRRISTGLLTICFGIVAYVSLLGVLINKVAPVE
jgi:hypothetical protein